MRCRVRVAVEREQAPRVEHLGCQRVIKILARRIAVEFDGDIAALVLSVGIVVAGALWL